MKTTTQLLPETQSLPETIETDPRIIEIEISEVDRQTAGAYRDLHNCIICTALRNRGINANRVGVEYATIDGKGDWLLEGDCGVATSLNVDVRAATAPFYHPSVVGKKIRLRRE